MFIVDLQSKFKVGMGSFAEGTAFPAPIPPSMLEEERSTALLPAATLSMSRLHATVNWKHHGS
jgi:hypothetical protein